MNEQPRKKGFCSSHSLGMKLVNLSVIDEDNQNEIRGVWQVLSKADHRTFDKILYNSIFEDEIMKGSQKHVIEYQPHILWLGDIGQGSHKLL